MNQPEVISSSKDEDAEHLHVIEEELTESKEKLEEDVEDTIDERIEVELEEILELSDDYKDADFDMIAGRGVVGVSESCMERIKRASGDSEITVPSYPKKTLRHEWAHNIDGEINKEEYSRIEVETPLDINNAPKEAYAIFEDLRVSSHSDMDYGLPRGFSAVKNWSFLTNIDEEGDIVWNDNNPSVHTPHSVGYYAAKTLEEAANKKFDDRKEAENSVRRKLLETTTVEGLLSEISKAHQELGHPFYIDVLDNVSSQVAGKDEYELTVEMTQKTKKYDGNPSIGLEEFYRDHAIVQSYEAIHGGSTESSEQLRQKLQKYRRTGDHDNFVSDNIMIDSGLGTSDEYLEWISS
jgi:hypothetical protein